MDAGDTPHNAEFAHCGGGTRQLEACSDRPDMHVGRIRVGALRWAVSTMRGCMVSSNGPVVPVRRERLLVLCRSSDA